MLYSKKGELMDKTKLNMKVLNKVTAFKMLDILHSYGLIDNKKYNNILKKRIEYSEYVLKNNKIVKGGM